MHTLESNASFVLLHLLEISEATKSSISPQSRVPNYRSWRFKDLYVIMVWCPLHYPFVIVRSTVHLAYSQFASSCYLDVQDCFRWHLGHRPKPYIAFFTVEAVEIYLGLGNLIYEFVHHILSHA